MSTKRKLPTKLAQPVVKSNAKQMTKETLDESKTVVSGGGLPEPLMTNGSKVPIEISSDSNSEDEEDEDEEEEEEDSEDNDAESPENVDVAASTALAEKSTLLSKSKVSSVPADGKDTEMEDAQEQDDVEDDQPTFGDLVRATTSADPIDVSAAFPTSDRDGPSSRLTAPSGTSLSTVLTQALKTSDTQLLESCLSTTDLPTVRLTIQRLSSPLASTLLSSLATRLHRRPGRAGSLMVWIQWTLVAHGGYLATQPELVRQLAGLNRVVDERARSLQSLLQLKGKLDMLEAQGQLRRNMMAQGRRYGEDESDDEEGVVYVEGEESDEEEDIEGGVAVNGISTSKSARTAKTSDRDAEASSSEDEMPTTMNANEVSSEDDADSDGDDLIDDEASESDNDSAIEEEVDHDDEDEMDEDDESDDAAPGRSAPPTKLQKTGGLFSRQR